MHWRPRSYYRFLLILPLVFAVFGGCRHNKATPKSKPVAQKSQQIPQQKAEPPSQSAKGFAEILQLSQKEIKENKLYYFSNEWYGTPYLYGGCSKSGVDCSCFTALLYQNVYHQTLARAAGDIFKASDEVSMEDAKQGDLVFFKIGGRNISHVGVLLKGNWFIHASSSKGVMVSSLQEAYFKKYFFCAGKVKKV